MFQGPKIRVRRRTGEIKGLTDNYGTFSTSHTDTSPDLGIVVEKSGYYATHIGQQFYYDDKRRNPTFTVLLKKLGKPISMYAKKVYLGMPVFDKPVGYDLIVGDWVGPYGKGVSADILFTGHFENQGDNRSNYTLTVSFPNPGDGIQGYTRDWNQGVSGLISAHEAPPDGYQLTYEQARMPNPDRIYYFRIRTVLDSDGNVKSTLYGKIYGEFMQFTYYLNPTPNDRNVEFDLKHNLLKLNPRENAVQAP